MMSTLEINKEDWHYVGEGNAGVVFSYVGNAPSLEGKALKISKQVPAMKSENLQVEKLIWGEDAPFLSGFERDGAFANSIMRPLFGGVFCPEQVQVSLSSKTLKALLKLQKRQKADEICLSEPSNAILLTDLTKISSSPNLSIDSSTVQYGCQCKTLAVEIKPKCGFIPFKSTQSNVKASERRSKFHLLQRLKLAQGKIEEISSYNPPDLFSSDQERQSYALHSLFENPQNNLKVFVDSKPVEKAKWQRILQGEFFYQTRNVFQDFSALILKALNTSGVLKSILRVQRLSKHEIDFVYPLFLHMIKHTTLDQHDNQNCPILSEESRIEPVLNQENEASNPGIEKGTADHGHNDICFPARFESIFGNLNEPKLKGFDQNLMHKIEKMSFPEKTQTLRNYLVSATAKDCSVMIAFRKSEPNEKGLKWIELNGLKFSYHLGIVDLDRKSVWKIPEHYELEQQLSKLV